MKTKKTSLAILSGVLVVGAAILMGPKPSTPELTPKVQIETPMALSKLEDTLKQIDAEEGPIRPGNESKIEWINGVPEKTEYVVMYLHGFTASPEEGAPVHRNFAKRYQANLFLPRLQSHGLDVAKPMEDLTPENYLQSAKEALMIASHLGKKVVVMGCSTGGTLALYLAAHNPELIHSVLLYSPNIKLADPSAVLLTKPWGKNLAKAVLGSDMREVDLEDGEKPYWYKKSSVNGLISMASLVEHTMHEETFKSVKQPVFMGYFYENEDNQDQVVSVEAMREMFDQLGSEKKKQVAFPNVNAHVICSDICSDDYLSVEKATFQFADSVLKMIASEEHQ
ncbi:alpha/beta hydrolase [Aureibacter tunicatorum]|uniref:Esterase/lipase n=1 Tax=Aureibacter tunicatorum TaxID=866807 RepID=A0AAE3XL96_9BACT|nr:alpha/beta hydrolase [Aureibacter tunicatorum]MDR6238088.1 esterase/lipase [Aureibacter tunicatorum]BDD03121.1 hypothetical protein AUTU_06040 [Aureibacter tunicatorum]